MTAGVLGWGINGGDNPYNIHSGCMADAYFQLCAQEGQASHQMRWFHAALYAALLQLQQQLLQHQYVPLSILQCNFLVLQHGTKLVQCRTGMACQALTAAIKYLQVIEYLKVSSSCLSPLHLFFCINLFTSNTVLRKAAAKQPIGLQVGGCGTVQVHVQCCPISATTTYS